MESSRRGFLRLAGFAIAAMGIDPELLIWKPGEMVVVPALPHQVTLLEWAQRVGAEEKVRKIVELISANNERLYDPWLLDQPVSRVRSALPSWRWRDLENGRTHWRNEFEKEDEWRP